MDEKITNILFLDEEYGPILTEGECTELKDILGEFIKCYDANQSRPVEEWLNQKMQEMLPDRDPKEISGLTKEIITALQTNEENQASLSEAVSNGRSKESWFASVAKKAASAMSAQEKAQYFSNLEGALQKANESLYGTITTQAGAINQNPRLDGFIAEQYHAQTFNMNAEAVGSPYRAKVLEPTGSGYAKNSVDIEIIDANGKVVRRYQSKYCKDANATREAFEHGDYRGQRKLVPEGQEGGMQKKASTVLEAPDGTTSNALSKSRAKQMQHEAQSGKWNELNWNEYAMKDLALGIGKQARCAALQGAAISIGFDVAQRLWNGEEIKAEEVVKTAVAGGADFGVKAAAAGALKVGAEKNIIKMIPKGTPAATVANIAFVGVEDAKILGKMAVGELSWREGVDKLEQTTVASVAGLAAMGKGTVAGAGAAVTIGAAVGTAVGPAGMAIGGFIGGTIGYMAGSKIGESVIKGARHIRKEVGKRFKKTVSVVKDKVMAVGGKIWRALCS